jgi:hypothetical protein
MHFGDRFGQLLRQADQILNREGLLDVRQAFAAAIDERDRPWIARFIEQLGHAFSSAQALEEAQLVFEPTLTVRSQRLFANDNLAGVDYPGYARAITFVQYIDPRRWNPTRRCRASAHRPPPRTANPST